MIYSIYAWECTKWNLNNYRNTLWSEAESNFDQTTGYCTSNIRTVSEICWLLTSSQWWAKRKILYYTDLMRMRICEFHHDYNSYTLYCHRLWWKCQNFIVFDHYLEKCEIISNKFESPLKLQFQSYIYLKYQKKIYKFQKKNWKIWLLTPWN